MTAHPKTHRQGLGAALRAGLGRALGTPGTISLRRDLPAIRAAHDREHWARQLADADLRTHLTTPRSPGSQSDALGRALASLREAGRRALGQRATDEQLRACLALTTGHAVEMDTGEGKTLAGALAAALLASGGRRVHLLSVNDYLAWRDATWMGPLYALLGLPVAWVGQLHNPAERRAAYRAPVVYLPVTEVGFDVLRDRFAEHDSGRVRPVLDAAIIDEADAALIDEATVPLVLAGPDPVDDDPTAPPPR